MTKGGLSRHLSSCAKRQEAIAGAKGKAEHVFHLQVQDAYSSDFWLHLEMPASATLKDLDNYLRAIWLECCGHLSQFSFGGWGGGEIGMSRKLDKIFPADQPLTHIYDFGSSSETLVKFVGERDGSRLTKHPVMLMARNNSPEVVCMECDETGTYLCMECLYEDDVSGILCAKHVKDHPHDNYGEPLELVNSPRMGMCGYDGPAEPPY
jgi:hypothetical protein